MLCVVKIIWPPLGLLFLLWNFAIMKLTSIGCNSLSNSSTNKMPPLLRTDSIAGAIDISFLVPSDSSSNSRWYSLSSPAALMPLCLVFAFTWLIFSWPSELLEVSDKIWINDVSAAFTPSGISSGNSRSFPISLFSTSNCISSIPKSAVFA